MTYSRLTPFLITFAVNWGHIVWALVLELIKKKKEKSGGGINRYPGPDSSGTMYRLLLLNISFDFFFPMPIMQPSQGLNYWTENFDPWLKEFSYLWLENHPFHCRWVKVHAVVSVGDCTPVSWSQRDWHGLEACLSHSAAGQESLSYRIPTRGIQILLSQWHKAACSN